LENVEANVAALEEITQELDERLANVAAAAETFDTFLNGLRDLLVDLQGMPVPTRTPYATAEAVGTISPTPEATSTGEATVTATPAASSTARATRTPRPSATPIPLPTSTPEQQP
jgi:hypothetical protein